MTKKVNPIPFTKATNTKLQIIFVKQRP